MKTLLSPLALCALLMVGCQGRAEGVVKPIKQTSAQYDATVAHSNMEGRKSPHALDASYANDPRFKAETWDALLAALTPDERAYLDRLNAEYFGILAYNDAAELNMMRQLGMPLPQDFLAAAKLNDSELKAMADAGDPMAKLLYPNRQLDKAILAINGLDESKLRNGDDPRAAIALPVYVEISAVIRGSNNPFAIYMNGRMQYSLSTDHSPEYLAGAIFAASAKGDRRATRIFNDFAQAHPGMNNTTIMQIFSGYVTDYRKN
ncbi:hypothetical protein [Thermomonas sp.]|uniref:hypothetical protein n=1 Tax=Thermomonas sp. TaxID=1971895 RepID=UPI0025991053|nr:hypothetical protein [Thermomonas sp.]HQE08228.1 hypothetical protein [Thermomonas sp.]